MTQIDLLYVPHLPKKCYSYPFEYSAVETNPTQTLVPAEGDYSNPKSFVNSYSRTAGSGRAGVG
jgi:hypothetical protein